MFFSEFFEGYSNLYLLDDLLGLLEKDGFRFTCDLRKNDFPEANLFLG